VSKAYYTGRRIDGCARIYFVENGGEVDITRGLEAANITFITDLDWIGTNAHKVEAAKTIIWHATNSHAIVHMWGPSFAWELMGFLDDGWAITRAKVDAWLTDKDRGSKRHWSESGDGPP